MTAARNPARVAGTAEWCKWRASQGLPLGPACQQALGGGGGSGGGTPQAAAPLPTFEEVKSYEKVSGPLGSQGGQWYRNPDTGQEYLLKPTHNLNHSRNEIAAGQVYKEAGIAFPNTAMLKDSKGNTYTLSEKVPDLHQKSVSGWERDPELQAKARADFGVDAWLSHWDVLGLVGDNTLIDSSGNPVRIESGGAMAYRGMGGKKPSFNPSGEWVEPSSMRTSNQGRAMYGKMTDSEAADSLEKVSSVDLSRVEQRWKSQGIPESDYKPWLDTLAARQAQVPALVAQLRTGSRYAVVTARGQAAAMLSAMDARVRPGEASRRPSVATKEAQGTAGGCGCGEPTEGNGEAVDAAMPSQLEEYWVSGAGADQIGWGEDGSFDRCVSALGQYVSDPEGTCANLHKAATGEWPQEKGVPSSAGKGDCGCGCGGTGPCAEAEARVTALELQRLDRAGRVATTTGWRSWCAEHPDKCPHEKPGSQVLPAKKQSFGSDWKTGTTRNGQAVHRKTGSDGSYTEVRQDPDGTWVVTLSNSKGEVSLTDSYDSAQEAIARGGQMLLEGAKGHHKGGGGGGKKKGGGGHGGGKPKKKAGGGGGGGGGAKPRQLSGKAVSMAVSDPAFTNDITEAGARGQSGITGKTTRVLANPNDPGGKTLHVSYNFGSGPSARGVELLYDVGSDGKVTQRQTGDTVSPAEQAFLNGATQRIQQALASRGFH